MSKIFSLSVACVVSFVVFAGCSVAAEDEATPGTSADAITTVGAIECNPRTERGCDRGDSCLGVDVGRETKYVCAANRCLDQRDCRAGYACRVNHCIALEREQVRDPDDTRRIDRNLRDLARRRWNAANDDGRNADDGRGDRGRDDDSRAVREHGR